MAGGLGRTGNEEKDQQESGQAEGDAEDPAKSKKKPKVNILSLTLPLKNFSLILIIHRPQRKNKKTIETNVDSLSLSKFDLEYDVDPLFKKTSAMFDEGRNGGVNFLTSLILKVIALHVAHIFCRASSNQFVSLYVG